ncbi:Uncharacterised protein [Salmonella enterica subsp. enterica serovar Bovismorbificans]|uniref:Uncharacterized protein n=1 Tax=Salmonella enterica subsp. enterica serovar Bovismorbificans TaxID=58097 RepID=A0A655C390_SALET|nr:Uncharacterised protein [Salmonella enterica subsp. enterica serovar Bovismorbificans]
MLTGKQFQPTGADVPLTEQHQANAFFGAENRLMQPLNQALSWAGTQHRHQTDALLRLPGKFHWLTFKLLPEAMAM